MVMILMPIVSRLSLTMLAASELGVPADRSHPVSTVAEEPS
jgi:hypothetical protein